MNCERCGRCCTSFGVCVTPSDIARISSASGLSPERFVQAIPEQEGRERKEPSVLIDRIPSLIVLSWKKERACIFFDGEGCAIYQHRPMLCRTYPFCRAKAGLGDMKSRACANRWAPGAKEKNDYLVDLERYEKEVNAYALIAGEWNRRGGGSLGDFLAFAVHEAKF